MQTVLISTYELGRQPFGLASPAAWLRRAGAEVICIDTAVQPLDRDAVRAAALIGVYVPMHTATRLAGELLPHLRELAPDATIVCYGLYAPLNADYLRERGANYCMGGEFEAELVKIYAALGQSPAHNDTPRPIILDKLPFIAPDRRGMPGLSAYANLITVEGPKTVGYTEASRGCKHLCRHCPIVPVYNGRFRVVPQEVVLEDVRRQVAAGARHITFGDPDFLNGPGHALPLARALHAEFPDITYDATIKIEHLLKHADLLAELRATGCILITSALEALDERILARLEKRHTRADIARAAALLREVGIALNATFVAFTPWTTRRIYRDFLHGIAELDLIDHVTPIQYAIRLLIPSGSRLLELPETQAIVKPFDRQALAYPWENPDPAMDRLQREAMRLAQGSGPRGESRREFFAQLCALAATYIGGALPQIDARYRVPRPPIPLLSEPWYC